MCFKFSQVVKQPVTVLVAEPSGLGDPLAEPNERRHRGEVEIEAWQHVEAA